MGGRLLPRLELLLPLEGELKWEGLLMGRLEVILRRLLRLEGLLLVVPRVVLLEVLLEALLVVLLVALVRVAALLIVPL